LQTTTFFSNEIKTSSYEIELPNDMQYRDFYEYSQLFNFAVLWCLTRIGMDTSAKEVALNEKAKEVALNEKAKEVVLNERKDVEKICTRKPHCFQELQQWYAEGR